MRLLLFYLLLSLPQMASAQYDFSPGSYVLESNPQIRLKGYLKQNAKALVVQNVNGKNIKHPFDSVRSFKIELHSYIKASGFTIDKGFTGELAKDLFVELLDSGAVSLMRYRYPQNSIVTPNGLMSTSPPTLYLLRRASERESISIPYAVIDGAGKRFREALLPFVSARPDLIAALRDKKVTIYNLVTFISSLNRNEPFLTYPLQGSPSTN
ncbi:hypothetical protein LRS06_15555 [Hymenobacter sp. J193]|uniref:hypothetical protein n=1 Tax=Hymenobacter sp. J193 TaxID=2898429 RepID=UPI002151C70D|nr:hypothetical protein [Hymenobacter sp. J193]MCR5889153.1 hypothetical protein [Hymenobacter sp. J193]